MSHLTTYEHRVSRILVPSVFCSLLNRLSSLTYQPTMTVIMQNKANLRKARMNANFCFTKDYENGPATGVQENKPNPSGLRCLLRSCRTDQTEFQDPTCPHRSGHLRIDRMNRKDQWWVECFLSHWVAHFSACAQDSFRRNDIIASCFLCRMISYTGINKLLW